MEIIRSYPENKIDENFLRMFKKEKHFFAIIREPQIFELSEADMIFVDLMNENFKIFPKLKNPESIAVEEIKIREKLKRLKKLDEPLFRELDNYFSLLKHKFINYRN